MELKILFTEPNFDIRTPGILQKKGIQTFIPKTDIPDVHEFDLSALEATVRDLQPDALFIGLKFQITKKLLELAPIKKIYTRTTGTDHIDLDYCKEKGIEVVNLKGEELEGIVAVPELCIGMMIYIMRTLGGMGFELKGKTLLVIGTGRIGKMLLEYAQCFEMNVLGWDIKYGQNISLENLLEKADVVSLNISSTKENRNFMDLKKFKMMKDGAFFLNSARPWLVEEGAFQWALDNKLNAAWVDFDLPFKKDNLITTPHLGGKTWESSIATEKILLNKILNATTNNF